MAKNYSDSNLVPVSATDLQPGMLVMKVGDTYFTGFTQPSGSANFYKCASVDTSNYLWTGYKAILNAGVYSFQSTSTTGLTYTSVTPVVGNIYTEDALAKATLYMGIPTNGLLLYAPLSSEAETTETGQTITKVSTVNFTTYQGIPCAKFDGGYLTFIPAITHLSGNNPFTITWWQNMDSEWYVWQFGLQSSDRIVAGTRCVYYYGGNIGGSIPYTSNLSFWCLTYDGSTLQYTVDGVLRGSGTVSNPNNTNTLTLGRGAGVPYRGYLANFRIYNRVLSESEILSLSRQITPVTA